VCETLITHQIWWDQSKC